tara:strand:+ start:6725 stop:7075 length:351 start_codon:yes stop_codon:yes gene_type:complete
MIKKVSASSLQIGMYIQDLNCGWMDHPFATNTLKIDNQKTLDKLQSLNLSWVYIDTDKGLDLPEAPSREEANREQQNLVEALTTTTTVQQARKTSFQGSWSPPSRPFAKPIYSSPT